MKAPFKKGDLVIGVDDGCGGIWMPHEPQTVYSIHGDKVYFSKENASDWVYWNGSVNGEPRKCYVKKLEL